MNRVFVFVAFILLFAGCSSSRKVSKAPAKSKNTNLLLEKMTQQEVDFHTFKTKFSVDYSTEDDRMSAQGQIRITNDSIIWLSLTKAGIEVFRGMVTPDSLFVLNRLGQQYAKDPISSIKKMIDSNLDYDMLQALFTGNDFHGYKTDGFVSGIDNDLHWLGAKGRAKQSEAGNTEIEPAVIPFHALWLNPETYRIEKTEVQENTPAGTRVLNAYYGKFEDVNGMIIPHTIDIKIADEADINLHIDYKKVTIDEALRYPFSVSTKYQRVTWM